MNFSRISPKLVIGILLGIFFLSSFSLRVFLPFDQIFGDGWIKFSSIDAYFHMRLVDNIAHNFPAIMNFDPYFLYPGGETIGNIYFADWLTAGFAWLIGLGSPSQNTIDVAAVYFPAILAALTVIPVFFIGRALFNRWAGIFAALLVAILPGEYLGRTILGFNDTPAVEVFFSTTALAFFILAIKKARQRNLTFSHIIQRDWGTFTRPVVYSALAGIFAGFYLISWVGALLFIFVITLYLIIQFIIDHLKRQSVDYLGIVSVITFLVALIIFVPFPSNRLFPASMVLALVIPVGLVVISRIIGRFQLKPFYYPVAVVVIGAIAFGIAYAISPSLLDSMIAQFGIFTPAGATGATTLEMQPFLSPQGPFSTSVAWSNFTTSFFLFPWVAIPGFAFISLAVLIYLFTKRDDENRGYLHHVLWVVGILIIIVALMLLMNDRNLRYLAVLPLIIIIGLFFWRSRDEKPLLFFFLWTLIILMATLAQRRFAYYLVVNIALLSGYISWELVWWGGIRKLVAAQEGKQEQVQSSPDLPEQPDYYEILGITRSASRKEIKAAFRNLSAKYHPGGKHTPEAEAEFNDINKAYEVLSNNERRASFDHTLSARVEKKKQRQAVKPARPINTYYVTSALAIVAVLFLVFFPNINKSKDVAAAARFAPNDGWQTALTWLKDNSPEPFSDPNAYYQLYEPPAAGETYKYPESAYGVTAWWDYGYWITRIAHRMPSANPGQDPTRVKNVADLFLSEDEDTIRGLMTTMDSSYVVADYETATTKFWAVATWTGRSSEEYIGSYLAEYQEQLRGVSVFEEAYYRSTFVRLYNFDGKAVTETKPVVITFEERIGNDGNVYRLITDADEFTDYQEAVDFIESEGTANHKIVGIDPFTSPIPLEAVDDFELVYSSETGITRENVGLIPGVKIFKYNGQ